MRNPMPPWPMIDTVLFDMDGTLLDLHFDNFFWQDFLPRMWAEHKGIDQQDAYARLSQRYTQLRGTLNWYCLDFWESELELDLSALKLSVKHKIAIRPSAIQLLEQLSHNGKRLLLITNAHPGSLQLKMRETGIDRYFEKTISAHSLGLAKENHGFWAALQEQEHFDPERSMLIDDSPAVLRQAEREGIRHLYAIHQPDSQQNPLLAEEFPQIIDFDHIMPDSGSENAV
jgi:5'-nucleotidase